jgi:pyruvate kinase
MPRRTKIIATLGPATDNPETLQRILEAGVNLVRVNFSHGEATVHRDRIQAVRKCAEKIKKPIGILVDLQGPKIRISRFQKGKVFLEKNAQFILDASLPVMAGTEVSVGIDYKELPNDVAAGDTLLLDDGRIVLQVYKIESTRIICRVIVGGELSNNKGINRLGGGLSARALTDKDREDIKEAAQLAVDYVAVSFPREAADILQARELLAAAGSSAGVVAKIERAEAVKNIDEIIAVSDAVMVARGDLAVEIGEAEVPGVQKLILKRARELTRPVIIATQMMESMISSPVPTRAEVSDVANAVLDQTDAVMLSAETAVGRYPEEVVRMMAKVCLAAEKEHVVSYTMTNSYLVKRVDEAIAHATIYTANHLDIKAIIALTESGTTPLMMSRIRTGIPIFALSRHAQTLGKMTLYSDVYPIAFDVTQLTRDEVNVSAVTELEKHGFIAKDDLIILTKGDHLGVHGGTNAMKIIKVGEVY